MKRKLLSILATLSLTFSVGQSIVLADQTSSNQPILRIDYEKNGTTESEYVGINDFISPFTGNKYNNCTFTLLDDYTYNMFYDPEITDCISTGIAMDDGSYATNIVFDLAGHTLTLKDNSEASLKIGITLACSTIKNGNIVFDYSSDDSDDSDDSYNIGILAFGKDYNSSTTAHFEDVNITCPDNNIVPIFSDSQGSCIVSVEFNNCTMNNCNNISLSGEASVIIESGSYSDLDTSNLPTGVQLAEGSIQTNVDGVKGTVITSPDTKAIVVDNGVAYTFSDAEQAKTKAEKVNGFVYNLDSENKTLWVYDTDAGTYGDKNDGMTRFLFKVLPQGDITETGIKFFSNDVTLPDDTNAKKTLTGESNAFYGDLIGIPADDSHIYYAAAYVTIGENTYWSDIQKCSLNPNRHFTNYSSTTTTGGAE